MRTVLSVCRLLPRQQWIQGRYKNCSHVTLCIALQIFSGGKPIPQCWKSRECKGIAVAVQSPIASNGLIEIGIQIC